MQLNEERITANELAGKFVSAVLKTMALNATPTPPCAGGNRPLWNVAVRSVLQELGAGFGYTTFLEFCTLDLMWWGKSPERMVLAVESEMANNPDAVENDFEKLPSYKSRFKLLAFSADVEAVKKNAEGYLELFGQHAKNEEYLLVGFTPSGPRCFHFPVPNDGKLERISFKELQLSNDALRAA
jgi:hypothetical protein